MPAKPVFVDLMQRVREGDQSAMTELAACYGEEIRRMARIRLRSTKLRRLLGASDIVQSVMASFFKRADRGEYDDRLQSPEELLKLLATMVRFKVVDQARKIHAERRGGGADAVQLFDSLFAPIADPSPDEQAERNELIALAREVLSDDDWQLWQLRHGDRLEWDEIAERLGGTGESQRKRLERVRERLRAQFAEA